MRGRKVKSFQMFLNGFAPLLIFLWIGLLANANPTISKESPHFDFSQIEPISNPMNTLKIANVGDTPLEIHRVRACCGATANITTNSIAPGAAATLTVALKPMAKPGPFRKKVTLYTNDPSAPVVEIPIVGEVIAPKIEVEGDEVVIAANVGENWARPFYISSTVYAVAVKAKADSCS